MSESNVVILACLDSDKYGKISLMPSQEGSLIYSHGLTINGKELVSQNEDKFHTMVDKCNSVDKLLNGGLAVNLDLNGLHSDSEVKNAIMAVSDLQSFRPMITHMVCSNCGKRSSRDSNGGCIYCTSTYLIPHSI